MGYTSVGCRWDRPSNQSGLLRGVSRLLKTALCKVKGSVPDETDSRAEHEPIATELAPRQGVSRQYARFSAEHTGPRSGGVHSEGPHDLRKPRLRKGHKLSRR